MRALLLLTLAQSIAGVPNVPETVSPETEWPPIHAQDYATLFGLGVAVTMMTVLIPTPPSGWKRGLLFDDAIIDGIRVDSKTLQDDLSLASDIIQDTIIIAPAVLDIGLTTLLIERRPDLAWRLMLIDLEAGLVAAGAIVLTKRTIGRVRPGIPPCEGTTDDFGCRSRASRRSLVSGHATASFTAAGLICAHHDFLHLWGEAGDTAACASAVGLATAASVLRVISNRHYPTDVLAGGVIGLLAGYGLPYLVHFSKNRASPSSPITGAIRLLAVGGAISNPDGVRFGAGLEGGVIHHIWLGPTPDLAVAFGVNGQLLRDTAGDDVRRVTPWAALAFRDVAAGMAIEHRSVIREGVATTQLVGGPELRFGVREEGGALELVVRWLPLIDGRSSHVSASANVALLDYFALRAEVVTLEDGATATLGVGGQLPW